VNGGNAPTQLRKKTEADELGSSSGKATGSREREECEVRAILALTMAAAEDQYARELGSDELEPDELDSKLGFKKLVVLDSHPLKARPRGGVRRVTSEEVRRLKAT